MTRAKPFIIGLIPARGGSKGVPRKNIAPLCGKPLIWYTIHAATQSKLLHSCYVSTEDDEIARVAERYNVPVIERPKRLATDKAPTLPVIQHAFRTIEKRLGRRVDAVVLLQPTTPFRKAADIDAAIRLFLRKRANSVVSVSEVPAHYSPYKQLKPAGGTLVPFTGTDTPRRQDAPPTYYRNGEVYVTRRDVLLSGSMYGDSPLPLIEKKPHRVNIDTPEDMLYAEFLLKKRLVQP